jgi:hypothetical protein
VFICHASEDKEAVVEPLAAALKGFGVRVWYDKFTLKIGDSLTRNIDRGLANSDYGIVVLSPAFIEKPWPEFDLRGLSMRELGTSTKVILPIWYNIGEKEILKFSPSLADKTRDKGVRIKTGRNSSTSNRNRAPRHFHKNP